VVNACARVLRHRGTALFASPAPAAEPLAQGEGL
jgi:hypothetical protein